MSGLRNILVFLVILLFPISSFAAVFQDGKEFFSMTSPVTDDLYITGKHIELGEKVQGDVFAAGEEVIVPAEGQISEDVYGAGRMVSVSGNVGDDLHAAGEVVNVAGTIAGDVFAAGNSVTIGAEPNTEIGKDVYAAGSDIVIASTIHGNVRVAGKVRVASTAVISGNLTTYGNDEPVIEDGAKIGGDVTTKVPPEQHMNEQRFRLVGWVRSVLALFVLSLVVIYLAKTLADRTLTVVGAERSKALLTGILWLILFVPVAILLVVTFVGMPLAVGLGLLTVLLGLTAKGIAAAAIGRWVLTRLSWDANPELTWVHALVGAVLYKAVQLVPVIGGLFTAILFCFFFGAVLLALGRMVKPYERGTGTSVGAA